MTVAAFMDLALYDPEFGYYARAVRRSGRTGDFFTSVDVGPLFGELVEVQLAEMDQFLHTSAFSPPAFDLVEAGAANGRLASDVLHAARKRDPAFYDSIRLHLVEISPAARDAQRATLGDTADRLQTSSASLPESFEGVLLANELLDALPVHQVVMRDDGLRETYVTSDSKTGALTAAQLKTTEGPLSTPRLQQYLDRAGITLEEGWRVEISLCAIDWIRDAARRLRRGFMILIDYGHQARELYSVMHASGTLTALAGHRSQGPESAARSWLHEPGEQDITAHVDFTSVRAAAEEEGLETLGFLDQTYFLLGLLPGIRNPQSAIHTPDSTTFGSRSTVRGLKTLIMPGGLGSAQKVLILGKNVGRPSLRGCSFKVRVT